jgi:flagellum-specific peptidoglycan hydrolase FlgJ
MKIAILTLIILLSNQYGKRTSRMCVVDYISNYAHLAIQEHNRCGIPASITLAQAILESAYGTSNICQKTNNHFGIKYNYKNLYKNYRVYSSVEQSYKDHSNYLWERCEYMFDNGSNWLKWCNALQRSGYAQGAQYGRKLEMIVIDYKLYQLDNYEK